MSHHHHPLESTMKQCRFTKSVSFHRGGGGLSVCVSSQVPAGSLYGRRAAQSPVSHRKREWTLGWGCWTTGKLAGHTDQRHSLNLFAQPCPNPTTLPPLPSASPFLIIHCWPANISFPPLPSAEWTRCKSDKCSSRVGRIVLPLLVFPLFYPESCVLCGPRRIPTCHGSTTRWGRSFGESLGSVWDTRAGACRGMEIEQSGWEK